jgi:Ecdysteroid kinase-like family
VPRQDGTHALRHHYASVLLDALSRRTPGTKVRRVEMDGPIWGTATNVFLRVDYEHCSTDGPPETLCLKGGFNDEMRAVAGLGYRVESLFYRDVAPTLGESVPRCWYADEDPAGNQGLVIVDDLRAEGARFGSVHDRYGVDQVAAALESLADWHGSSWDRAGVGGLEWLTVGSQLFRPVVRSSRQHLPARRRGAALPRLANHLPGSLVGRLRLLPGFDDAWLAYRRHHLHGLMFALCPPGMQPGEVCTLMGDRYAAAAIDHDTFAAVGV